MNAAAFAPSPERTAELMKKATGQIGETAIKEMDAVIADYDAQTAHHRECLVQFRDELVKYVEENKQRAVEFAQRCGRFCESQEKSRTEFKEPIPAPAPIPEHPRDLDADEPHDEPVPPFLLGPHEPPRRMKSRLLNGAAIAGQVVGIAVAVAFICLGLPRV